MVNIPPNAASNENYTSVMSPSPAEKTNTKSCKNPFIV
jgi:hypothetical protein